MKSAGDVVGRVADGLTIALITLATVIAAGRVLGARDSAAEAEESGPVVDGTHLSQQRFFELASEGEWIGRRSAAAVLMVYSSYSCQFCARWQVTLDSLLYRYPEHLAVVVKHFADPASPVLAQSLIPLGAECAGEQGRFSSYHRTAFRNPRLMGATEGAERIAEEIGVPDMSEFVSCVRGRRFRGVVATQFKEAKALGVSGTPTSFLNGIRITGALPLMELERIVVSQFPPS